MRKYIFIVLLMFAQVLAFAQGTNVKGTVKDSNGDPVIGAAVMLEGTATTGANIRRTMNIYFLMVIFS